mmetsp:Transcript_31840/g.53718  ORF Transcript_31840/g.53718 Transcript_31840/m.53718 type:complete len:217 (-) Transcript_31840:1275-1925(-)
MVLSRAVWANANAGRGATFVCVCVLPAGFLWRYQGKSPWSALFFWRVLHVAPVSRLSRLKPHPAVSPLKLVTPTGPTQRRSCLSFPRSWHWRRANALAPPRRARCRWGPRTPAASAGCGSWCAEPPSTFRPRSLPAPRCRRRCCRCKRRRRPRASRFPSPPAGLFGLTELAALVAGRACGAGESAWCCGVPRRLRCPRRHLRRLLRPCLRSLSVAA